MDFSVSYLNFGIIVFNIIFGAFIPIFLFVYFHKKYNCETKAFWIGCAVFIVFALILQNVANSILLTSGAGSMIQRNLLIYGLYSGLMAAFFENVGRFLAFKIALRKDNHNDHNALIYAAGHGGFEIFMLLILPMISYAAYAMRINAGEVQSLFDGLTEQQAAVLTDTLSQLSSVSPLVFLLQPLERTAAMAVQVAMAILVWFAAKDSANMMLFPLALLLQTAINTVSVILTGCQAPILPATLVVCIGAALYIAIALHIWKRNAAAPVSNSGLSTEVWN